MRSTTQHLHGRCTPAVADPVVCVAPAVAQLSSAMKWDQEDEDKEAGEGKEEGKKDKESSEDSSDEESSASSSPAGGDDDE